MTVLLLAPILAPVGASIATAIGGWRRATATLTVLAAVTVLGVRHRRWGCVSDRGPSSRWAGCCAPTR